MKFCKGRDFQERHKLVDILFENLKKCTICAQVTEECHSICKQQAMMLNTCIILTMNNAPNYRDVLDLTSQLGEICSDVCSNQNKETCQDCSQCCYKTSQLIKRFLKEGRVCGKKKITPTSSSEQEETEESSGESEHQKKGKLFKGGLRSKVKRFLY